MKNSRYNNEKLQKGKKLLLRGVTVFFVLYIIVMVVSLRVQINEAESKLTALSEQLEQQTLRNAELDDLLEGDDQGRVEQTARDKLGLVYPDERVYIDIS